MVTVGVITLLLGKEAEQQEIKDMGQGPSASSRARCWVALGKRLSISGFFTCKMGLDNIIMQCSCEHGIRS